MMYPFTAIVGQSQVKTALLLNAINPAIGGILIRGEKGTAKSTAARALAALLPPIEVVAGCPWPFAPDEVPDVLWPPGNGAGAGPKGEARKESGPPFDRQRSTCSRPAPFVSLPIGATEDRLLGTLDIERALQTGERHFEPGLLAAAHRGVLYVDEVNLLGDHLVDVLLDAAAMGVNRVEREGLSVEHPARFILIGTMNPEEGDLRPQLLDRFGLAVEVAGPREPEARTEVVRRRLAWENDPAAFAARFAAEEAGLRSELISARERLPHVHLSDGMLELIARVAIDFEVDGLRADIVMSKTAQTLAAFHGRTEVLVEDVRAAAELALPHRRRRQPFEQPGLDRQRLDDTIQQAAPDVPGRTGGSSPPQRGREPETEGDRYLLRRAR
ncbi:MAG: ATP-binding protein [Ardenticatenaceae bacterium]|nr:ATP-binding protein [Ardenticatenaceae bacterium]